MDEFDIYLESTGSMNIYKDNTMSVFRNLLAHSINLEGDWRVALAEIIYPTNIKNITTTEYMIYTPKTPYDSTPVTRGDAAGVVVKQEDWSNDAKFESGEYITVKSILKQSEKGTETRKPLTSALFEDDGVELNFADGYGISVRDRAVLDVLGIEGVPDPNRGGFFIGNNQKVATVHQPIKNTYPPNLTAGTLMFFVNINIIEQQHVAGVKSPLFRIIDNSRRVVEDKLKTSSVTAHKIFTELQFKKLITTTIQEIQIEY